MRKIEEVRKEMEEINFIEAQILKTLDYFMDGEEGWFRIADITEEFVENNPSQNMTLRCMSRRLNILFPDSKERRKWQGTRIFLSPEMIQDKMMEKQVK